jgi:exodeoxyribonuclease V alpha subunit
MIVSVIRIVYGDDVRCVFWAAAPGDAEVRYVANQTLPRCPVPGECWDLEYVIENPDFGSQRRVTVGTLQRATGAYLVHLLSKHPALRGLGIGVVTAHKLNAAHPDLVDILAAGNADALHELDKDIAFELCDRWSALAFEPDVIRWLGEHNLPPRIAAQILAIYGPDSITALESNPYVLLPFLDFAALDKVARDKLNIAEDDPRRLVASVENLLYKDIAKGNTAMLRGELLKELQDSLPGLAEHAVELALEQAVIFERGNWIQAYAPALMERELEAWAREAVCPSQQQEMPLEDEGLSLLLDQDTDTATLSGEQRQAILGAMSGRVYCISGGAGVGKTTLLRMLAQMIVSFQGTACFMSISGRATRHIAEALGPELANRCTVKTVTGYLHFTARKLPSDSSPWLIVDEASMLDLQNAYRIISRSPQNSRLVLVGDPHQLPPVGPGLVFQRLVEERMPGTELTRIFRQAEASGIPQAARSIRLGQWPTIQRFKSIGHGVQYFSTKDPIADAIRIRDILAETGGEVQILTLFRGKSGAGEVNAVMHARVPKDVARLVYPVEMAVGEPVIFSKNDSRLDLQNGSLGTVLSVDDGGITARWDDGIERRIEGPALWNCALAHGITTHKAQGSQYERVVIVVPRRSVILDRALLYTAITRARQQAVLVGDIDAVREAIVAATNADKRTVLFLHRYLGGLYP